MGDMGDMNSVRDFQPGAEGLFPESHCAPAPPRHLIERRGKKKRARQSRQSPQSPLVKLPSSKVFPHVPELGAIACCSSFFGIGPSVEPDFLVFVVRPVPS